jgi:predicted component of type VI protein secretion system
MRALILVAGAALAVSACSSNDNANNTMNVDENLTAPADLNATDMNATDMNATDMNATNATDANATATGANATANASTNNAM